MNILIIGAPASGKGTLCKIISDKYGYKHISTGDIFRAEVASGSEKGKLIGSYINNGKLAPSDILIDTMKSYLSKPEFRNNMLLDGFGKTLEEAIELNKFYKIDKVIYLDAEFDQLVARILKRRICSECGTITTIDQAPDEKCPKCQSKLTTRKDDNEIIYKTRYDVFSKQTLPIVDYFKRQGKLVKIDANDSIENIFKQVKALIEQNDSKIL